MNKLKQLVIGIILFIPFLFLASGVSLVDCF
ncbi:CPBP family intramembrane glutamate endopeptidase, partial [Lacticaseibacillus paracasei]